MSGPAVVFDLDDTLIVEQPFAMASLREALSVFPDVDPMATADTALEVIRQVWRGGADHSLCLEMGIASWEGLWSTFEGNHSSLDGLRRWVPTYRTEAWNAVAEQLGIGDSQLPQLASERFQHAQRRGHPVIAGAHATLRLLTDRYRIGLLTNGPSDLQRRKLARVGFAAMFDAVVVSGELGIGKPNEAIFAEMLDHLDARPQDSCMVGDNWERDIVGATGAGMSAIWIRSGRTTPGNLDCVTVVEEIVDVGRLLG